MCSVAEGSVLRLLTVAQPVCAILLDLKPDRTLCDFVLDKFVRSVAQWLSLGAATQAPRVSFSFFQLHPERFLVVHHPIRLLLLGCVQMFDHVFRELGITSGGGGAVAAELGWGCGTPPTGQRQRCSKGQFPQGGHSTR
uniref:Putative secreted protein n=1 Tax=Anopheles darlingi TaxID=43151 RepID=A0A2M4D3F6_ANODA